MSRNLEPLELEVGTDRVQDPPRNRVRSHCEDRLRRRDHHLSVAMLVAKAFLPTKRRGMIPRPHDGDRTNCGASNLFWAPAGTRAPVSGRPRKLTAAQLEEVLALRGVLSGAEVGRRYYVSRSLICRIWKRAE